MISVKKLKELLNKLPDDYMCYAYEGEAIGIVVCKKDDLNNSEAFIVATSSIFPEDDSKHQGV